jgi:hypothetical protein
VIFHVYQSLFLLIQALPLVFVIYLISHSVFDDVPILRQTAPLNLLTNYTVLRGQSLSFLFHAARPFPFPSGYPAMLSCDLSFISTETTWMIYFPLQESAATL